MSDTEKKKVLPAIDAGYEQSDAQGSRVFIGFIVGAIVIAILIGGLTVFYNMTRDEIVKQEVLSVPNPELQKLHAHEQQVLTSYAWVDSSKGIVQIPIDRAMDLLVNEAYQKRTAGKSN